MGINMFSEEDKAYMQCAIELAQKAFDQNEVPVGAVLVHKNKIIAKNYNQPITLCDPTAHAEMLVLREGAKALGNYRLLNTTLYVTLEPCAMCAMALVHARVGKLVYAADDLRTGAVKSVFHLAHHEKLNHQIACEGGLMQEASTHLLQSFFQKRRQHK